MERRCVSFCGPVELILGEAAGYLPARLTQGDIQDYYLPSVYFHVVSHFLLDFLLCYIAWSILPTNVWA